ncbi:MAG: ATP-binding protein [Intestinibacter sp.]
MPPKRKNKNLKVKIDEIKKSAQELDDVLSKDKNRYREHIIKNNKFKKVDNRKPSDIEALELKGITNIVGQVGSGKSTFADALTNCLTKEKKRVMIICSSVNNIFEKYREYESLGKNVVPMIGTSMWQSHIEKAIDGKDYLKGNESKILTPACPLGGLIKESGISIRYGEEPCKKYINFMKMGIH